MFSNRITGVLVAAVMAMAAPAAIAQDIDIVIDERALEREPVVLAEPKYPRSGVRRGQEGWVRVNFVITPEGRAVEPIIIDSIGGRAFEHSVTEAMSDWQFSPADHLSANNTLDLRFEMARGRDLATSNFMRRYRRIVTHLVNEENSEARESVDVAVELGGWNLYESTMLWLMHGRVEGAEGDEAGKLESYRRALAVGNRKAVDGADRRELLQKIFELELSLAQYAHAVTTLAALKQEADSAKNVEDLAPLIAELDVRLASVEPLRARARLYVPFGGDDGTPLWSYRPARPSFSFDALNGNVERFEVRCEHNRLQGLVEAGKSWQLPEPVGRCQVFVFGDDGASFQFVEHAGDSAAEPQAVARSNGLDRRSRR